MQKNKIYAFLLCIQILVSCAQIVSPTGGNKDEEHPIVIETIPPNQSVNFNSNEIKINFNEYIELKNPDKIIFSPPLKEKPTLDYKGKQLTVSIKNKELDSNSTYSINLSGSITDIHEGLPLKNYTYSFSKSSHIDEDSLLGRVIDGFNAKNLKDYTVALYDTSGFNDSIPFKTTPKFYSLSNDSGYFNIHNLPKRYFKLFCYNDLNKNSKFDNNEDYGFIEDPIAISTNKSLILRVNKPDLYAKNKILDANKIGSNTYTLPIYQPEKIVIKKLNEIGAKSNTIFKEGNNEIDTFFYATEEIFNDSVVSMIVNKNNTVSDTVTILNFKKIKNKKPVLSYSSIIRFDDTVKINLNTPCKKIDKNRIKILVDSTELAYNIIDESAILFSVVFKKEEGKLYKIQVKDSAFLSFDGEFNSNKIAEIKTYSSNQSGEIKLNIINLNQVPVIISLVTNNDKEEEIYRILNDKNTESSIKYCNPGEYKIKIVLDTNKNKKWDKGNWIKKSKPEPVFYLKELIGVRILWEIEQTINIDDIVPKQ